MRALIIAMLMALPPAADASTLRRESRDGIAPFERFVATGSGQPDSAFYVAATQAKAPLVLFIQGSGCAPAFNAHFSMDSWLAALKTALGHALALPHVDRSRVLVIGVSEGATMAAALARDMPEVSHVALLGATGPSQYYDFVVNAYAQGSDDADRLRRLQELDATYAAIAADPASSSKFAWGHPYKRWSSFFKESSLENLERSKARVYIVSGMRDVNVPTLSSEVLFADLKTRGRDVRIRRIPDAGHDLLQPGAGYGDLQKEYDAVLRWFEDGGSK